MARDFAAVLKAETAPGQLSDPSTYAYGPQGARRARTFSQVIAEATRGMDAGMNRFSGSPNGSPMGLTNAQNQAPDWRGHYLGADGLAKRDFEAVLADVREAIDKASLPGVPHPHAGNRSGGRRITTNPKDAQPLRSTRLPRATGWAHKRATTHPFGYDPNAFANLRDDQKPRFLSALTDRDTLPVMEVRMDDLTAMQDRVDPDKVEAIRGNRSEDKSDANLPVVVRMQNEHGDASNYIADGHHRLTAALADGDQQARVRFKDITPVSQALKGDFFLNIPISKLDEDKNQVFGWASIIEENGVPVVDTQDDEITEEDLEDAFYGFAKDYGNGGEMHERTDAGKMIECMVFTKEKQQALGINLGKIGAWVGFEFEPAVFAKFKSGEYTGFSIGGTGRRIQIGEA